MSTENKKTVSQNAESDGAVSDEQLEKITGGNKNHNQEASTGQVSLDDPAADLNGDGDVTLHEVITFNRDQRDKS
ncbi:MAG: hypothetical protein AAF716_19280 [Cyanobacteria bacterium P01_D01_bin.1]